MGCAFISVEYRLIPPSSGNEILEDVQDALQFIAQKLNNLLQDYPRDGHFVHPFTVDPARTAVVGTSSGGLCAYLAALHAFPRPKAVLTMYGMGGNMLVSRRCSPRHCTHESLLDTSLLRPEERGLLSWTGAPRPGTLC